MRQRPAAQVQQLQALVEAGRVAAGVVQDREQPLDAPAVASTAGSGRWPACASRARIQFRLPRTVLISPLCATYRYGWASGQDGKVLVENRECTRARAELVPRVGQVGEERARPAARSACPCRRWCAATGWRSTRRASCSARLRRQNASASSSRPRSPSRPATNSWASSGRTARAPAPQALGSCGTSRQPSTARPSAAASRSMVAPRLPRPVGGQKGQAGRVGAGPGSAKPADRAEERVGHLGQDPGAVAGPRVAALRAAVFQVAQHCAGPGHHVVAAPCRSGRRRSRRRRRRARRLGS